MGHIHVNEMLIMSDLLDHRSITLLNGTGDVTISWTSDKDEQMNHWIQSKLDEGYTFFILPDTFIGRLKQFWKKTPIERIGELNNCRSVYLDDESAEKLFIGGVIGVSKTPSNDNLETTGVAHSASQVIRSVSTCAVRPIQGG